ncbi:tRNA (adenosine(37)-N6)-dimethylallyltransferase MiaA [Candidatus Kaiserbacteria bacterium RIFCSPHIGHO2_01_FULL_55_17]|uniref:tRNA dimethylallyltransferase n=1 Tax=Candidatus Kaiserbacteria bacterium RIFCSPHIGHO2_01_FULL_55_17 TaxID=1798484 RepID=A0A1F6DA17_9BACT|nr:MAG: tRNA (adenosine(37)-N6)-dimethylallyltransferase MiaA [Candidatus Kaiserbacteria bacterium RIFCSPHIGHO2_01_FULL_55_17]
MRKYQKILVIVGPTSSGKSALAVKLARKFNGEVIAADSRQVYRGLDIGTGKITKREAQGVRHHLLDIASPKRTFTANDFAERASLAIDDIAGRGKLPIVTGGTGFYVDTLTGRIALPNVAPNAKLRAQLEKMTVKQLFVLLKKKDPRRAKTIEPHNKRRLIRALEIARALGHVPPTRSHTTYNVLWLGIAPPMKELGRKIAVRLHSRIKQGMITEAKRLHARGLSYQRMQELGLEYRALARHLQGKITRAQMVEELNRDIRRYAKKQLAYWKRNEKIRWFAREQRKKIPKVVKNWLR